MKMSVTEFKAKCTQVLREVATHPYTVEVTNRGKVIAVVSPPAPQEAPDPKTFWGSAKGTVIYIDPDFDEPMGDDEWEAAHE
jgi:prevent-host-death family protein